MKKFFSVVAHLLTFILMCPSVATAQTDCFQGPTGSKVIIDYYEGLTGEVSNGKVTLVDPFAMANREFMLLRDNLSYAKERLEFLSERYNDAILMADSLQNAIDTSNIAYSNACLADLEQLDNLLDVYQSIDDDIQARLEMNNSRRIKQPSDVIYDLSVFMTDYDYMMWHIDFCAEYLADLFDEIAESATDCSENLAEAGERLDLWVFIIETLTNNCLTIANYYDEHYYDFDYASILELQDMIYEQAITVSDLAQEIMDNADMPIDRDFALKFIISTANSTAEEMNEAIDELADLVESFNNIAYNFMPVLLGVSDGATTGMYVYLTSNDGVLDLPSEMTFADEGGNVVAIDGNIFGDNYPNGFPALKSIVIPASIESIRNGAFAIGGIESVCVEGESVPELQSDCFTDEVYASAVLYVKDTVKDSFKSHPSWSRFAKIESLPDTGVDTITARDATLKVVGMTLYVEGNSSHDVMVWDAAGVQISSGLTQIELPSKGIYLVKIGNKVVKVVC